MSNKNVENVQLGGSKRNTRTHLLPAACSQHIYIYVRYTFHSYAVVQRDSLLHLQVMEDLGYKQAFKHPMLPIEVEILTH